jgi:hypothetical protein
MLNQIAPQITRRFYRQFQGRHLQLRSIPGSGRIIGSLIVFSHFIFHSTATNTPWLGLRQDKSR